MRRFGLVSVLALLLLSLFAGTVLAHAVTMVGGVSVTGGQVTIRLLDALNSPIPDAKVSVATGPQDQAPGKPSPLAEGPKGTYKGAFTQPATGDIYQMTIDVTTPAGDMHQAVVLMPRGRDVPELMATLNPVTSKGSNWGIYLYIAAAIVVVAATVIAVVKRRASADGEG